jgi:hypothetical protein
MQVQIPEAHGDQLLLGEIAPVTPFVAPLLAHRVSHRPVQLHTDQIVLIQVVQVAAPAADPDARLAHGDGKLMPTLAGLLSCGTVTCIRRLGCLVRPYNSAAV